RLHECAQPARRGGEVRGEDALELEERLVVERDTVEIADRDAAEPQAGAHRVAREVRVVAAAGEPLLLRGGRDLPLLQQARRGVVVVRRDPEDVHPARTANATKRAPAEPATPKWPCPRRTRCASPARNVAVLSRPERSTVVMRSSPSSR